MDDYIILPNRECGTPRKGLYMTGVMAPHGTLLPFTAIAAPFRCNVPSRTWQYINVWETIRRSEIVTDLDIESEPVCGLPPVGIVDMWGKRYYKNVSDAIEETLWKGVSRRIAQLPKIDPPFPVFMVHVDAVVDTHDIKAAYRWVADYEIVEESDKEKLLSTPWKENNMLGRVGKSDNLGHPYVDFWYATDTLKRLRKYSAWLRETGTTLVEGVFGISWITAYAYVLGPDEEKVPDRYKDRVIPAFTESDPRL